MRHEGRDVKTKEIKSLHNQKDAIGRGVEEFLSILITHAIAASGNEPGDGGVSMTTTLDKLLAEKEALLERLQQEDIGPAER